MQFYTDDVEIDMRSPFDYEGIGRAGIAHAMRERDPANRLVITADELPYLSLDGAVDPVREHVDDAYGWARLDEAPIYTVTDAGISSMIFTGAVEAWVAFRGGSRQESDPLAMSWVNEWATQDADAVRSRYADDAVVLCFQGTALWCADDCTRWEPLAKEVMLHELAHAWMAEHVDQATIAEFLRVSGRPTWADRGEPWEDLGAELAAETVAWALMDEPAPMKAGLEQSTCDQRAALFETLTGTAPAPTTPCLEPGEPQS